ncbi:MAG: hypothetical protein JWM95_4039 [Gemmatimonadetes bacterium]|nr:hypothetical protein [Gemmatimonadota bacterium]
MRFLHCSDIHVTQQYDPIAFRELGWRRSVAMLEHTIGGRSRAYAHASATLRAITADVERHAADHLLITGDLTAYATELEFQMARDALGSVGGSRVTCSVVPGNHDYFTPGSVQEGRFERHFRHLLESDFPEYCVAGPYPFVHLKGNDVAVVGLCSAMVPPFPGLASGLLGTDQLASFGDLLRDVRVRHRAVLVMVHHAPLDAAGQRDTFVHGLRDGDALLQLMTGPQYAVLHGHLHARFHHAATATRPHLFCAGSSTRIGDEGYWLIEVMDGRIRGGTIHAPRRSLTN